MKMIDAFNFCQAPLAFNVKWKVATEAFILFAEDYTNFKRVEFPEDLYEYHKNLEKDKDLSQYIL